MTQSVLLPPGPFTRRQAQAVSKRRLSTVWQILIFLRG